MAQFEYPEDLRYTREHEWVRTGDSAVRVGITSFAQDALGDVVYLQLPSPGTSVQAGEACGEIESTKSVSDVYAPVSGTITAVNEALESNPELVNSDPYGDGWMFEVEPEDPSSVDGLLDAVGYRDAVS